MMPCISFSLSRYLVCSVYSLLSLLGIYTNHSSFISSHASFGIVNKLVKDTNAFSLFLIGLWIAHIKDISICHKGLQITQKYQIQ